MPIKPPAFAVTKSVNYLQNAMVGEGRKKRGGRVIGCCRVGFAPSTNKKPQKCVGTVFHSADMCFGGGDVIFFLLLLLLLLPFCQPNTKSRAAHSAT